MFLEHVNVSIFFNKDIGSCFLSISMHIISQHSLFKSAAVYEVLDNGKGLWYLFWVDSCNCNNVNVISHWDFKIC